MSETGPIYGVELIDSLPWNPDHAHGMRQAMPSRSNLEGVRDYRQGQRVVAGYEVLLNHWRKRGEEVERLQAIAHAFVELRSAIMLAINNNTDLRYVVGLLLDQCKAAEAAKEETK